MPLGRESRCRIWCWGRVTRLLLRDARCKPITGEDTAYAPARAFGDGCSVIEVTPAAPVAVYHLALARQGTLRVMGMEIESYHPGEGIESMMEPRLLSLFIALFPHLDCLADFGPMAHTPNDPVRGGADDRLNRIAPPPEETGPRRGRRPWWGQSRQGAGSDHQLGATSPCRLGAPRRLLWQGLRKIPHHVAAHDLGNHLFGQARVQQRLCQCRQFRDIERGLDRAVIV